jgi:hypothetical protein
MSAAEHAHAANRGQHMAKIGQGDKRYEQMASSIGALAAEDHGEWVRPWWHAWRWPAALLAGIVLWLTLVAIAGAAPPQGAGAIAPVQATIAVHNP